MERRLTGHPAAPGFAAGPGVVLAAGGGVARAAGTPDEEARQLRRAIAAARDAVAAMTAREQGAAAEILGFQVALLEDDALAEGAFAAIARGVAAERAWRDALAAEIEGYTTADDETFRARAADLADIRDRVLGLLVGDGPQPAVPPGGVVVARDLPPSLFLGIDWTGGGAIVLGEGSARSHVAMLARARGVPMVVGVGDRWRELAGPLLVDGDEGTVVADPASASRAAFERRRDAAARAAADARTHAGEPAFTADGTRVRVLVNVARFEDVAGLDPAHCDGIGLVRTEFLIEDGALGDEERHFALYRSLAEWARGKPVTIRTLDAGGDKPVAGYTVDGEPNPFLGMRGLRLSLAHPELFGVQLRALARAALLGDVRIMLPMVTSPHELAAATRLLDAAMVALAARGVAARRPPLGIMVEVPAAAIAIDQFHAAFFSIGSNDLTQYVTAAARDQADVAELADPAHPAVLRLIAMVARHGATVGRDVSLCGDAGGDPRLIAALVGAGLRSLSVAPALLARTKAAIREVDLGAATVGLRA